METYCHEMAEELGHRVDLTVQGLPGRADGGAPSGPALVLFGLRMVWYLLRHARSFDVIHAADLAIWPLAWLGGRFNRQAVTVVSVHGTDAAYPVRPGVLPWLYGRYIWLAAKLDGRLRLIANSEATAALCRRAGFREVTVAVLGVRDVSSREIEPTERFVLFVGRLTIRKGGRWFVQEVLPLLPPDIMLRIAGTIWDHSERPVVEDSRVEFLGPVFGEELASLRRRSIAVVMPNLRLHEGDFVEGFGLAALETAADGGIICAARLDGLIDAVRDGETGFLLPSGSPKAWAAKIEELSGWSPTERNAFVKRARAIVAANYSWKQTAAKTLAVYGTHGVERRPEP
jgi:phosphatidylinositol alpha-1,6-mannosyltransferase